MRECNSDNQLLFFSVTIRMHWDEEEHAKDGLLKMDNTLKSEQNMAKNIDLCCSQKQENHIFQMFVAVYR